LRQNLVEVSKSKPDLMQETWRGLERKLVVVAFLLDQSVQRLRRRHFPQPSDTEFLLSQELPLDL
jgi:hypothetical protein